MNDIEQALRDVIGEEESRAFNRDKLSDVWTLKKEIMNYNKKLHNIIKSNEIHFDNEVSFILKKTKLIKK